MTFNNENLIWFLKIVFYNDIQDIENKLFEMLQII